MMRHVRSIDEIFLITTKTDKGRDRYDNQRFPLAGGCISTLPCLHKEVFPTEPSPLDATDRTRVRGSGGIYPTEEPRGAPFDHHRCGRCWQVSAGLAGGGEGAAGLC